MIEKKEILDEMNNRSREVFRRVVEGYLSDVDISLAKKYGWKPSNDLDKGFDVTLKDFVKNR